MTKDKQKSQTVSDKIFFETSREVLSLNGEGVQSFLQNLVTVNIADMSKNSIKWSLLLTPQGRFLYDFYIIRKSERLVLIDISQKEAQSFITTIKMYLLRLKIEIRLEPQISYQYLSNSSEKEDIFLQFEKIGIEYYKDPSFSISKQSIKSLVPIQDQEIISKHHTNGDFSNNNITNYILHIPKARLSEIFSKPSEPKYTINNTELANYWHKLRIIIKRVNPSLEMIKGSSLPGDYDLDKFSAIAWDKGCFVGQEVTARIKYRSKAKKSLVCFRIKNPISSETNNTKLDPKNILLELAVIKPNDNIYSAIDALDRSIVGKVVSLTVNETKISNVLGLMLISKKFEIQRSFFLQVNDSYIEIEHLKDP